nr:MAG TPA: hypothetical protein [Bacteriophage sp.]
MVLLLKNIYSLMYGYVHFSMYHTPPPGRNLL